MPDGFQYENSSTRDVGDLFYIFLASTPYFYLYSDASCELLDQFQIDWVGNALPRICTKVETAVSLASSAQLRPFSHCQILNCNA